MLTRRGLRSYSDKCNPGKRGSGFQYDTLTIDQLKRFHMKPLLADDCILFMWMTAPMLPEQLKVMRSWGFKYKTIGFTWIKTPRGGIPRLKLTYQYIKDLCSRKKTVDVPILEFMKFHWGMGSWTRANPEYCVIGVRGKPERVSKGVHSVVICQLLPKHSEKPAEVRDRIVKLMGDVPRLEMFAREPTDGWDVWGNEVENDVEIGPMKGSDSLKMLKRRT